MKRFLCMLLTVALVLSLTACGSTTESESTVAAGTGVVILESEATDEAEAEVEEEDYSDNENYQEALYVLEVLAECEDDSSRYDTFGEAQSAYNYDENNQRYFVNPSTYANLPQGLNDIALSLGDYEVGLSEKTDYGWFVVMRLPFSTDELNEVKNDMVNQLYNELLTQAQTDAVTEETEALDTLDFEAYLENLTELQTLITQAYAQAAAETDDTVELEEAVLAALPRQALEDCVFYLTDGALSSQTTVMVVDGVEVPAETLLYFFNYEKNSQLGTSSVSDAYLVTLLNQAKKDVVFYTTAGRLGRECGLELSQEEVDSIVEAVENTLESSVMYLGCNTGALENIMYDTSYGNLYAEYLYGEDGVVDIPDEDVQAYAEENNYYSILYVWFYEYDG